jgi:hypothetical protein
MGTWLAIFACTPRSAGPLPDQEPFTVDPAAPPEGDDTGDPGGTTSGTAIGPDTTTSAATGWIAADAGPSATCGVRATGDLVCWGNVDLYGSFYLPYEGPYVDVAVGGHHVCAITSAPRTLVCFGHDDFGQSSPPSETGWVEVSAGEHHTCARMDTGAVACWGDDSSGQLGLPAGNYERIAAGYAHTCGLTTLAGVVVCAGSNAFGESSEPASFFDFNTAVAAGRSVTCAITSNDSGSACVGDADDLQLSDQYISNTDIAVGNGFVAVLSGKGYDARQIHGVGNVPWDEVEEPVDDESWYTEALPSARYDAITAGDRHVCLHAAETQDLFCLGDDSQGQVTIPL